MELDQPIANLVEIAPFSSKMGPSRTLGLFESGSGFPVSDHFSPQKPGRVGQNGSQILDPDPANLSRDGVSEVLRKAVLTPFRPGDVLRKVWRNEKLRRNERSAGFCGAHGTTRSFGATKGMGCCLKWAVSCRPQGSSAIPSNVFLRRGAFEISTYWK